jgi:hypothetical protein
MEQWYEPNGWNRYLYSAGDPVTLADPTGQFICVSIFCSQAGRGREPLTEACLIFGTLRLLARLPMSAAAATAFGGVCLVWGYYSYLR